MPGVREWVQLLLLSHFSAHAASPMVSFASMITWLLQPRLTQKKRGLQLPQDPLSTLPIWRFSGHSCVVISLTAEINTSNREQKPLCEICLEKNTSLFCQGKYSACDWFSSVAELCAVFYQGFPWGISSHPSAQLLLCLSKPSGTLILVTSSRDPRHILVDGNSPPSLKYLGKIPL